MVDWKKSRIFAPSNENNTSLTLKINSTTMMKGSYTMSIDIEFEFNENEITAVDATDLIDYFAKANVELNDERINILDVKLTPMC